MITHRAVGKSEFSSYVHDEIFINYLREYPKYLYGAD